MAGQKSWLKYRTMGAVALDAYYASTARPLPQEDLAEKPARKAEIVPQRKKHGSLFAILGTAVCAGLLLLTMFGGSQVRNMEREVSEMEEMVSELEAERDSLRSQLDEMVDLEEIARQARLMGMHSPSESQMSDVSVPQPEESASEETKENPIRLAWSAIVETITSMMEYLQAD